MKAKAPGRKKSALFFCGIGIERPADASIRTIQTLKRCDVVFYIHGDGIGLKDFFGAFCSDVRTYDGSAFRGMDDAQKIIAVGVEVCRELKRGRTVGYVTYGHPILFSDAYNMANYCRAQGYSGQVIPALSSTDSIMAILADKADLFSNGYRVCLGDQVLDTTDVFPLNATLVLLGLDRIAKTGRFGAFCERLQKHYSPAHAVYGIRCGNGEEPDILLTGRVDQLDRWNDQIVHMMSFVLPRPTQS